jgi:hypothetical protein
MVLSNPELQRDCIMRRSAIMGDIFACFIRYRHLSVTDEYVHVFMKLAGMKLGILDSAFKRLQVRSGMDARED